MSDKMWDVRLRILVAGFTLLSISSGCSPIIETLTARLTPSPEFITPTFVQIDTSAPNDTPVTCAFVWSSRSLSDVSTEVNKAFQIIGLTEVEVEASAYGEDCVDTETNQVVRFTAMQTDFYFNIAVENINDPKVLGDWVERIVRVMDQFKPGQVPGPNPGYYGIIFSSRSQTIDLWFPRAKVDELLNDGVTGSDLYEALLSQ